jgi:hypothetical protein
MEGKPFRDYLLLVRLEVVTLRIIGPVATHQALAGRQHLWVMSNLEVTVG